MKQATFLVIGLLSTLMFLALACGDDEATATSRPRATATPTTAVPATATITPAATPETTETPVPATATITPSATPEPTETPVPTGTTITPAATPESTETPVPATSTPVAPTATTPPPTATPPAPVANLEISVNGDALEFDASSFSVDAGSQVTLTFANVSTAFQHNWVLAQDGTKDDVAQRGTAHPGTDWVQPDDPDVIDNTKLLNAGTTGSVTFTAPPAGTYQFVCTFPGHNFTMFGTFEVSG